MLALLLELVLELELHLRLPVPIPVPVATSTSKNEGQWDAGTRCWLDADAATRGPVVLGPLPSPQQSGKSTNAGLLEVTATDLRLIIESHV